MKSFANVREKVKLSSVRALTIPKDLAEYRFGKAGIHRNYAKSIWLV